MTVKEVEQLTGMTRANIRYYEMEGLFIPKRNANGHREYSERDVDELNKIKLLRILHISIEEIKELVGNKRELSQVLEEQSLKLEREKSSVTQAIEMCHMMQEDRVDFWSLDAAYYFTELEKMSQGEIDVLKQDQVPQEKIPIRRFMARGLDLIFYTGLWHGILIFVLGADIDSWGMTASMADQLVRFVIMIICEGILLSRFGTTVGKGILGIRVTNIDGGKLTFMEACERAVYVVIHGYGVGIPIYGWYREWKSYKLCKEGEPLKWEEDSCIVLRDRKTWRNIVYAVVLCVYLAIDFMISWYTELPDNRGELTVAEFSENYNQMAKYPDAWSTVYLNEKGDWELEYPEKEVDLDIEARGDWRTLHPKFTYIEENGIMTGINITGDTPVSIYGEQIVLALESFIYAKDPKSVFSGEISTAYGEIAQSMPMEELIFEFHGVKIIYKDKGETFEIEMCVIE